ncbi:MAG TPA: phosphatidylserine decarboxylase, partial [Archangium sp.]|nr:phosphatidylserine decarboxylase [Archangium sp.]
TVILVFEAGHVKWDDSLQPEAVVRMGRRIGEIP